VIHPRKSIMSEDLSTKMRAYLAEIYRLADMNNPADGYVGTSELSEVLFVTAPAVNRMINRLKEQGLLEHQPYQGIRLTDAGRAEALQQLRAHRIAEAFLQQVMGFKWDEIYQEAAAMSVALNETMLARMAEMSQHPTHCPHGEPIPDAAGNIAPMNDMLLSNAVAGMNVRVTRMRTRDSDRLRYIEALGLTPASTLEVLHVAPFNGPLQLKMAGEYRIIGHNLAELIRVRPDN
jgi:DtxR family Mn-dependent transcriptional regulator